MQVAALIVAAGKGTRIGSDLPKQFRNLGGVPVITRAVDAFAGIPVHVVIGAGQEGALIEALSGREVASVTLGGLERADSVRAGLAAVAASGATHVLIHDAARPLLPRAVIEQLLAAIGTHDGAVPVLPVVDTLASGDNVLGETTDRNALNRVQTPQAFHLDAIIAAHEAWTGGPATDDAQVARAHGVEVALVAGDPLLDKLTHPADFARAEATLGRWQSRTATGFDVHRLEAGESLWLGGIEIAHTHGLSGHSDADVALHAITDALLGTIAAGDIGSHFPPSDAQWRGARSGQFVEHAAKLIAAQGGKIVHVDLTLMCEAPKIGPHREVMRKQIAALLGLDIGRVSVKATTTERLGFTGRGEGIAAQAAATAEFWQWQ
ncbi:MAG TPA: bifunctional 2-C-methyl-D-erythritol 4-phosphate cytidylyltransferase/2-C-methyl-D-erythritol 2,4-cyclodiphosphate synthase [Sphingomonas sp.]|jgi:2-C-methyl-D-erythritol 4-phosphate cytidylyltransferase/2-C-methyl-D-erythritol 2,4-cyclodiphosphate synthase|nr:bifunctional 2-C-methyl-D-erythritol 4-phosphate cytidylyltransferase/2-C-methyl-D-erythritol 2,4-cyclodiphosphate synthase [Sphingomonas sp.]